MCFSVLSSGRYIFIEVPSSSTCLVVGAYVSIILSEYSWFILRIRHMTRRLILLAYTIFLECFSWTRIPQHLSHRFLLLCSIKHLPTLEKLDLPLFCGLHLYACPILYSCIPPVLKVFHPLTRLWYCMLYIYSSLCLWWRSILVLVWVSEFLPPPESPRQIFFKVRGSIVPVLPT